MLSEKERNVELTIEIILSALRSTRDARWLTGSVPVVGCAKDDPEDLLIKARAAAEIHGFGFVGLNILNGDRIAFNGSVT